ncbi:hypothetical protein BX070DRAFT_252538 [Coemansia spiralis]|nr:hypothetical protein BX070DRAFT_252538 [Coemansia spiralis]
MATTYDHVAVAPARHKRKGIPMRSPCQRDMVEAPGVVFRFPDKISSAAAHSDHLNHPSSDVSALSILPSSAGLPSGLGAKTAAAVIAAAAAVSSSPTDNLIAPNNSTTDNTAATIATTAAVVEDAVDAADLTATASSTAGALTQPKQQQQHQGQEYAQVLLSETTTTTAADQGRGSGDQDVAIPISSANSTPILKPAIGAIPIHRSASNVLHYPELLSDLRDKLIQIHQIGSNTSNHNSSGVESDGNHANTTPIARRARAKRTSRGASSGSFAENESSRPNGHYYATTGARRSGLRGGHGSRANASSPGLDSSNASVSSSSAAKAPAASFHRRHSIGTIQSQADDEEEMVDVEEEGDDEDEDDGPLALSSAAPRQHHNQHLPSSYRHNGNYPHHHHQARRQHDSQVSGMATSAKRHVLGSDESAAGAYSAAGGKRKRDKDSRSPSVQPAKRTTPLHRLQSPPVAIPVASGGNGGRRCCASCGANSTPCWRPGLIDKVTLCNQCGLRYKKGKVYCPTCSYVPTKTEIATGGAIECKRCLTRIQPQPQSASRQAGLQHIAPAPSSTSRPNGHGSNASAVRNPQQ